jgi:ribonuclease E
MAKRMLVDATHPEETRVVVVSGTRLEEFDFETSTKKQLKGNIYLAKIVRIEPSLQAAFVEYGGNRHGFLAFSEIHPDYYQIPVADRERLLAEQHRERFAGSEIDEEPHGTTVDKSDIVEAREEREALVAEWAQGDGGEDAAHPEPDHPDHDIATGEPPVREEPAPDDRAPEPVTEEAAAEADVLPPPSDMAADRLIADAAAPEGGLEPPTPITDVIYNAGDAAPAPDAAAVIVETPAREEREETEPAGRVAADHPAEVLRGPEAELQSAAMPLAEPADAAAEPADPGPVHGEISDLPSAGAHAEMPVDPAEAPQPQVTVETVGGEDLVEVRRPRRQPPSRQYKIQEVIKRRQIMLVQVVKEERGNKGAALTTYLSLAGRYCVLMPNAGRGGGISRKITSAADRKRLKEMLSELEVPQGMGVILRTAGLERSKPEIRRDYEYLMRLWDGIRELTLRSTAPALIYEESDLIKRSIRDLYNSEIDEVLVEGDNGFQRARDFMRQLVPQHARKVQVYGDRIPLFHRYQIETQLDAMHSPIVQLRSGAYIVLNPTEALVAIDVNSGRATKERNIEETALRTNLEAADEIARQVRLRDLSGLIVIDFIDMEDNRHQQQVERRLKEAMRLDRARIQIGRISPFGLLELSRQRLRPSLLENFTEICAHCEGTGRVRSVESTALHVLRAVEDEGIRQRAGEIVVTVPVSVALYILNQKRHALAEIEHRYGFGVMVAGSDSLIPPQFELERTRARSAVPDLQAAPLTASAIYEEFEDDYEDEAEPPAAGEAGEERPAGEERAAGDDADGDDGGRKRRRRRRRRRRDGSEEPREIEAAAGDAGEPAEIPEIDEEQDTDVEPADAARDRAPRAEGEDDGDRRRRRRGRRGGRNRRRPDGNGDAPADRGEAAETAADETAQAREAEVREGGELHAGETEADDSLAPAPAEPAAVEAAAVIEPALLPMAPDTPLPPRANDDLPPPPAPSAGTDVAAIEERPLANDDAPAVAAAAAPVEDRLPPPIVPVTVAEGPPPKPRRGWWRR